MASRDYDPSASAFFSRSYPQPLVPGLDPSYRPLDERVASVFGLTRGAALPPVNRQTLSAYHGHLARALTFPFVARYWEEVSPLESIEHLVKVLGLIDARRTPPKESGGLRCLARMGDRVVELPLADLEVSPDHPNFPHLEDYWYWFWNWRNNPSGPVH